MKRAIKILSIVGVFVVAAVFMAALAIGNTTSINKTPEESGTKYVVSTGSVSKIGELGILDDNGQDYYTADIDEDLSKVGLDVVYAGFVTDGKLTIDYIEPVYFDYTNDVTHIKSPISRPMPSTGWGD